MEQGEGFRKSSFWSLGRFREGRNEIGYQGGELWEARGSREVTGLIPGREKRMS